MSEKAGNFDLMLKDHLDERDLVTLWTLLNSVRKCEIKTK